MLARSYYFFMASTTKRREIQRTYAYAALTHWTQCLRTTLNCPVRVQAQRNVLCIKDWPECTRSDQIPAPSPWFLFLFLFLRDLAISSLVFIWDGQSWERKRKRESTIHRHLLASSMTVSRLVASLLYPGAGPIKLLLSISFIIYGPALRMRSISDNKELMHALSHSGS